MIIFGTRFRLKKNNLFWNHKKKIWEGTPSSKGLLMEDAKQELMKFKNDPEFDSIKVVNVRTKIIEVNDSSWKPREFLDGFNYEYVRSQFYASEFQKWIKKARSIIETLDGATQTVVIRDKKIPIGEIYLLKLGDKNRYGYYSHESHRVLSTVIDKQIKKYLNNDGTMLLHSTDDLMILKLRMPAYQKQMKDQGVNEVDFIITIKLKDLLEAYDIMSNERRQRISKTQKLKHIDLTE